MKTVLHNFYRCFLLVAVLLVSACGSPEQRAQSYYDRGIALIEKKDDFAARLELLNAVKFKSDKIEAWRALAGINERTKAYQLLFENLRRIVELDPNDTEARVKLGKMLLAGGAPEAALRIVEGGGEAGSRDAGLLTLKAAILLRMRDTSGGLIEARKATELDPGDGGDAGPDRARRDLARCRARAHGRELAAAAQYGLCRYGPGAHPLPAFTWHLSGSVPHQRNVLLADELAAACAPPPGS